MGVDAAAGISASSPASNFRTGHDGAEPEADDLDVLARRRVSVEALVAALEAVAQRAPLRLAERAPLDRRAKLEALAGVPDVSLADEGGPRRVDPLACQVCPRPLLEPLVLAVQPL